MSQARVTDFFSQRKRGVAGPVKPAKPAVVHVSRTRSRSSNKDKSSLCSSSVHAEFVRVIDEAVELSGGPCAAGNPAEDRPSSPRTPKRSLAENEFDLGGAVFSATADHSTAKKRRQVEGAKANNPKKETRTRARKKLVLPQDSPQAAVQPSEVTLQHPTPPAPVSRQKTDVNVPTSSSPQSGVSSRNTKGPAKKVLSKEDLVTLKSRLQKIKKQAEEITSAAPTAAASSSSSSSSSASVPHSTRTTTPAPPDARSLKVSVAQAKELAAKAQRRKEAREAEESTQSDTPTQDSELPAYQRYHTLAQAAPPGLSLPYHYKLLGEMFRSMDTLVGMLHNRCETATFPKIKQGVQDMMHKRFEESHVCQIKTVFPEAYTFRQEKNIPTFNSSIKKGSYQLTVEPVIPSDQSEARPLLLASRLLERRQVFHHNLVSIVKQHHQVFLSSLVPPVSVPDDKLTRWHPKFNVDTVPAVPLSSLPQPPHTEKLSTAQEVLDKARSFITPKMEKALVSLAKKTEDKAAESKEPTPPQNPAAPEASAPVPTALKGLSQSLLDRIRAKEAQKIQAAMTRNPDHEDRLLMMSRLPELARILRSVFVAEKKPALIMEVACNRTMASYRSALSSGEMEKHLHLLAEVAADWLTIHPVRKDFYLKLNKNMELNIVLDKLSSRLREEERL